MDSEKNVTPSNVPRRVFIKRTASTALAAAVAMQFLQSSSLAIGYGMKLSTCDSGDRCNTASVPDGYGGHDTEDQKKNRVKCMEALDIPPGSEIDGGCYLVDNPDCAPDGTDKIDGEDLWCIRNKKK